MWAELPNPGGPVSDPIGMNSPWLDRLATSKVDGDFAHKSMATRVGGGPADARRNATLRFALRLD